MKSFKDESFFPVEPKGDQTQRYQALQLEARRFAVLIDDLCPDSREKSLAITKLEESLMWADKSIAVNE